MKLASLNAGRDGQLIVVSRDLTRAVEATGIASTLQAALEGWSEHEDSLRKLAEDVEADRIESFPFDERACASPLPRAYQWLDGSAYVNHVELLRRSRGRALPESFWREPLIYQGGSDGFGAPHGPIHVIDEDFGVDFEAELAVIIDDVPMGLGVKHAPEHIKLYMLANDVSLRRLIPPELDKGFGFLNGKPATTFSPIAATVDEFGAAFSGGKISAPMEVYLNDSPFGRARPNLDLVFTFADLIAHSARTRSLGAGTIVGGGTISNKLDGGAGLSIVDGGAGFSCIAEQRAVETIRQGRPNTPFMRFGDRVRIQMADADGTSIFGAIDQTIRPFDGSRESR